MLLPQNVKIANTPGSLRLGNRAQSSQKVTSKVTNTEDETMEDAES